MISPDKVESLRETLSELLAYKDKDLVRKEELGTENCLEGIDQRTEVILSIFSRIDESKLEFLTARASEHLQSTINEFLEVFSNTIAYDPINGNQKEGVFFWLYALVLEHLPQTQVLIDYLFPHDAGANDYL